MSGTAAVEELPWWRRAVIYEVYLRSFKDTSGDGIGDLQGVIEKLDYLNDGAPLSLGHAEYRETNPSPSLRIDAMWITPFYPSPMEDFGYDIMDFIGIDPLFGDLPTFDRLLHEAHKRGIKVIIDIVLNHSSDRHPWFIESRRSRDDPKHDWYIWRDAGPDGSLPNNWGSPFGGPTWTWDEATGQYYLHQFLKEQPELNWRNPELRRAMMDVLRFWLDRGVDGIRMDVIGMIVKDAQFRDNPPNLEADPGLHPDDIFGRQVHLYNEDQDEVHQILQDIRTLLDEYDGRCALGELGYPLDRWVKYYGEDGDGLHLPLNFRLMERPWTAQAIRQLVEEIEAILPSFAWPTYVLGSHDAPRMASRLGGDHVRIAAMLLLTLRGTPILYQGDELGIENARIPAERIRDPQGLRLGHERSRDMSRSPMLWDGSPYGGFSTSKPWLPVSADYAARNVAAQGTDLGSALNLYRRLIRYRRSSPAMLEGSYRSVNAGPEDCFVYLREHGKERCLVVLNFASESRALSIPLGGNGSVEISTYLDRYETTSLERIDLRPHEGLIIEMDP
ncbi:MAG: alpha-amylase family glycosyl hydrolase [Anaerolineae bacterium]|nr:MAG: alpha-amylase family glycosyl hydrolase [Anaerolineae bacterium]